MNGIQRHRMAVLGVPAGCAVVVLGMAVVQRTLTPSDPVSHLLQDRAVFAGLVLAVLASCAALVWRGERPLLVCEIQAVVVPVAGVLGLDSFFSLQLLLAVYAVAVVSRLRVSVVTGLVGAAAMLVPVVVARPADPLVESLPRAAPVVIAVVIGVAVRSARRARAAEQRRLVEEQRALILETQRDAALRRTEIAGELHDSVGHGLTTIIALSQGLAVELGGRCEDPTVGEALAALTRVARESLEDTRAPAAS